ncbi:MAG: hypothetical protein RLZ37_1129 [Actinomycetota bacterium]|jgi:hypothetical protein
MRHEQVDRNAAIADSDRRAISSVQYGAGVPSIDS